ncbi:alpha/beta hydrolase [Sinomonas flava]|uniref:Alpha/beta hydrolase n=1 Tax=Sinomonas flava TaxID=496857 RepID=A0ABP5NHQ3_9MICC
MSPSNRKPRERLGRAAWLAEGLARDAAYVTIRQLGALGARRRGAAAVGPDGTRVVRTTPAPPSARRPPAVVLIPGIYEPAAFMDPLRLWLEQRGHEVAIVEELGWNLRPLKESASLVAARLEEVGIADALVVAHSKGGLIGKELMVSHPRLAAGMVAASTPFAGHPYSRFAPTPSLRAFNPALPALAALVREQSVNSRIVSVASAVDPVVSRGTQLEGARNVRLPVVGHFRILGHPAFLELLDGVLGEWNCWPVPDR